MTKGKQKTIKEWNMAKKIKYLDAVNELDAILEDLQSENVDVDEMSSKVKKAVELIKLCKQRIESAEIEVKDVVKEFEKS